MTLTGTKIVIVGGSFGGVNAAYALRRALGRDAELTASKAYCAPSVCRADDLLCRDRRLLESWTEGCATV